jgi:uncharacterized NAD(P)/FAD-binding protein YdhS
MRRAAPALPSSRDRASERPCRRERRSEAVLVDHIIVVGGGFSGSLHAINMLRHAGPKVTLVERAAEPGLGIAYGSAHASHVLNVRASNMSAFPDRPDHFVRWLEGRGVAEAATAFVPRVTYGAYLQELLFAAEREAEGRLEVVRGDAVDLELDAQGVTLSLADGRRLRGDMASLAMGNLPPHAPAGLDPLRLAPGRYWPNPWDAELADGLGDEDVVLVIGTGLTMVDVVLMLAAKGFRGRILAISRRGLLPRPHAAAPPFDRRADRPGTRASRLVREIRRRGEAVGWRQAVDELRPFTQSLWRAASRDEKKRFLRHLRPWWDVHRHRLAPEVHARLEAMIGSGQLDVAAGKLIAFDDRPDGVDVTWRRRGGEALETARVTRIVNCTGPQGDLLATNEPLLRKLIARGTIRPDAHRIGVDVDKEARTVAADGSPNDRLLALGPLTRGAFWEINAVPDIRAQVWALARRLSNAHWVEGEGL